VTLQSSHVSNLSFSKGSFPHCSNIARIIPLLKRHDIDSNNPASYRPIFNMNTVSKLLKRLILIILQRHILNSLNFSQCQTAYRRHQSIEAAVMSMLRHVHIYQCIDAGKSTLLVALDLLAAFDSVEHQLLTCFKTKRLHV
jgi:hypothetical protein